LKIKEKYLKELREPKEMSSSIHRCQEIQDFFNVLMSNPKHYQHEEIMEFLELVWKDDEGDWNENHKNFFRGKIDVDNQFKNYLPARIKATDTFSVYLCSPIQPETGKDRDHPQRRFPRRKIKLMNDGRVVINRISGKKNGKRHLKDVYIGAFRVEDIIAIRYLDYGDVEDVVAIHLGRRYWSLSFDTAPKAKQFIESVSGLRVGFQKLWREVLVEDSPLHLVGVMQRQLDEINKLITEIYSARKKNEATELDIKQWQDIINTESDKLKEKAAEIEKEFQDKIDAETGAAAIQNGFNQAILHERQELLRSIVDPDVFGIANFKEINKLIADAETTEVTDGKYNTTMKGQRWVAKNHHFHQHLTIHKHLYHHHSGKHSKEDVVSRETHSYTKTYTQTIIDLKRDRKYVRRKDNQGNLIDDPLMLAAATVEDTVHGMTEDVESLLDGVREDIDDTMEDNLGITTEDLYPPLPVSGGF